MPERLVDGSVKPLIKIFRFPIISLSVSPSVINENGVTPLIYTFTRSQSVNTSLTVNYSIGGTAVNGVDYDLIDSFVTFGVGVEEVELLINPIDNNLIESNKTVSLTLLENINYKISTIEPVIGTIIEDDLIPVISLSLFPSSVNENELIPMVFTFTRTVSTSRSTSISYSIGGTAVNGADYNAINTTLNFEIGETTKTVNIIPINNDSTANNKTVSLTINTGEDYTVGTPNTATGTIVNDDVIPVITLTVAPNSVLENSNSPLVYTFTRTGSSGNSITVNYTIGGTAVNGIDYTNIGTSVNFGTGVTTRTVNITPIDNAVFDADKTVILTLASGSDYEIGTFEGVTGTIINDEVTTVTLAIASPDSVHESYGSIEQLEYIFTRSTALGVMTVNFGISGTAVDGVDYSQSGASSFNGNSGTIIFDGVNTKSLIITPISNVADSINKILTITIETGGYNIGTPNFATGTIISNPGYCPQDTTDFYTFDAAP